MSFRKLEESLRVFNQKAEKKEKLQEALDHKLIKQQEELVFSTIANALTVALGQLEMALGDKFESSQDAYKFLEEVMKIMRTKGKQELMTALRRFDSMGTENFTRKFRQSLARSN